MPVCAEKGCVLPASENGLCRHHARMFAGDIAFQSHGCRASVETESAREVKFKRQRRYKGPAAVEVHRADRS